MVLSRRKLPPLNAIRAFEVSGRLLNFRVAAEELGVTQGAVAQQVRALEERLGAALFQRLPRGLKLTARGAVYLAEVTRAFDILVEATGSVIDTPEAVTISVTPTVATRLLIPLLAELSTALPDVELRTVATETLSDFGRGQVDIAVRLTHSPFPSSLDFRLLFRQDLVAVASPLLVTDLPRPLSSEQLLQLPLLHDSLNQWPKFLGVKSGLPGPVFNQTALALDAALAGQGVALACQPFVARDLESGRLIQVTKAVSKHESSYYLVRKRQAAHTKAADAVWAWCMTHLSGMQLVIGFD